MQDSQPVKRRSRLSALNNDARIRRALEVESLEDRRVLTAVTMTDYEQMILELVNRARANPQAEVARNPQVSTLNQGLPANTISDTPKQPLASVQELVDAGATHALDMLAKNYFSHYSQSTGDDPTDRAAAAGYSGPVGENIAWNGTTGTLDQTQATLDAHNNLFASYSHRQNMLVDSYEEVGMSVEFGQYHNGSANFNAAMTAQEFGFNSGNPYLTGVVFDDSVLDDDFFSIGESEQGVTITAVATGGATYTTQSGPSGGYQMKLPAGTYTVTASGGGLAGPMTVNDVQVSSQNVKVDFDSSQSVAITPSGSDIVGFSSANEFWVGESTGSGMNSVHYADLPSGLTFEQVGVADMNGDNLDDVVSRASNGAFYVALSTGNSTFTVSQWGSFTTVTDWTLLLGDFNGDGNSDVMGRAHSDGTYWLAQSNGSGFSTSYWGKLTNGVEWKNLEVGDFNGDGNDDIAARAADDTWWTALSNGESALQSATYWGKWSKSLTWFDVRVGDFDGDGKDDIAGRANNAYWWVNRSTGEDSFHVAYWVSWTRTVTWDDVQVGDFNGDGRDDLTGRANGQWWMASSNGTAFVNSYWGKWTTSVQWSDVQTLDLNEDGKDDIIGRASNGQWWVFQSNGSKFSGVYGTQWSNSVQWNFVAVGNFT